MSDPHPFDPTLSGVGEGASNRQLNRQSEITGMDAATAASCGIQKLSASERHSLAQWGLYMFGLGQHATSDIDSIKYDGRLVILDDGSRWEVEAADSYTADSWLPGDKVVVIDDKMYKLDEIEAVSVQEEI